MSAPRLQSQFSGSRRYMSSDKAHFAWVIARDLFGFWSRPEPTQCICQCPEDACSCPALECSAHLEVIKELSVEQAARGSVNCPVFEAKCDECDAFPWFLIFLLVISIFVSGVVGYLLGRFFPDAVARLWRASRSVLLIASGLSHPRRSQPLSTSRCDGGGSAECADEPSFGHTREAGAYQF